MLTKGEEGRLYSHRKENEAIKVKEAKSQSSLPCSCKAGAAFATS